MKYYFTFLFICTVILGLSYAPAAAEQAADDLRVNYGQIFLEDDQLFELLPFEISIFGGGEFINPYTNSLYAGVELRHKINSALYLGWEFFWNFPQFSNILGSLKDFMDVYGVSSDYFVLEKAFYMNWHYTLMRGHASLLGSYRMGMRFPLHVGVGFMDVYDEGLVPAFKVGFGPFIQWTSHVGLQFLIVQSMSIGSVKFAYPQFSMAFVCSF